MGRCPKDIPVAAFMQYYTLKSWPGRPTVEMVKELDFQKNWGVLADRRADAKDCVQCGRCEMACTQHLDIMRRLEPSHNGKEQNEKAKRWKSVLKCDKITHYVFCERKINGSACCRKMRVLSGGAECHHPGQKDHSGEK